MATLENALRISDIPRYWAQTTPAATALVDNGVITSFGDLWASVTAGAEVLRKQGVGAGDRVMLIGENSASQIALIFSLSELGAWPVIVNARLSEREVETIRAHCKPRLMVFSHLVSPEAAKHGVRYCAVESPCAGLGALALSPTDTSSEAEGGDIARQVAALIYTSGTTGEPKGVMVSHRGLLHFAKVSAASRHLTGADRAYAVLPVSHIFGLATVLLATFYGGASLYVKPRFSAEDAIDALASHDISILQGVPTMFTRILDYLKQSGRSVVAPKLRYVYTGGAALDPTLKRQVEATFGQPMHHGYGITEYAGSLFITRMDRPRQDTSAGEIVEGAEIRLVDAEGNPVEPGTPGDIWVRGPGVTLGYYRNPALTAETIDSEGWLNTGDIGRMDSDGALFIVGRTKDLIIRSGFNVYPIEVESVINTFPDVNLSAVVGRQTPDHNEEVVAFVEVKPGHTLNVAELQSYLKSRLSPYKLPAAIVEVPGIPTTASGKLLKKNLRVLAEELATSGNGPGPG